MENIIELFETYRRHSLSLGLRLELYHSSIVDWRITIEQVNTNVVIANVQHCDYNYVIAKVEVELKKWLLENNGGY